ncbi:MAG: hydroxyacylglutathione hydrolase [Salinisphaera sp.]|nr:hydroxyacylglutathione hydrolase [Salinisphaera sp.]
MPEVTFVRAFADNYIWMLGRPDDPRAAVIDPGDATPVQKYLQAQGLQLGAILITHHHPDHTGGVNALCRNAQIPVYGPQEASGACSLTQVVADGDRVDLDWLAVGLDVIAVPGHTSGHIAYFGAGCLFSGDALFRAGCGRLFEGDAAQMRASLARLRALPANTQVYCGHEYTVKNLQFAAQVEPDNTTIAEARAQAQGDRAAGRPTLPSSIADEMAINPFLRWDHPAVIAAAKARAGKDQDADAVFATLRGWKDAS